MPDFFNEIMKITAGVAPQPPSRREGKKRFLLNLMTLISPGWGDFNLLLVNFIFRTLRTFPTFGLFTLISKP